MKLNKILYFAGLCVLATGCNDLDTEPQGSIITNEQKSEVVKGDPSMIESSVSAIPATGNLFGSILGTNVHIDFGYPTILAGLDSRTADMVSDVIGYNWYSAEVEYSDYKPTSRMPQLIWGTMYNMILSANTVIGIIDEETTDPLSMYYRAQGLAYRANCYFMLAQCFQFTYKGNEDKPCVPIITDKNQSEVAANGAPRATVKEVYDQIMTDIDEAIRLLEGAGRIKTSSRADKKFFNASSAHGLRARINLVMQDYAAAATDAQYVITNSGATPYTRDEVSKPSFWDASDHAWLLGVIVEESDRVVTTGICNWPSMMCSFSSNGYVSVGAWRKGSKKMVNSLADSDVRKGWWLDAKGDSPNITGAQKAYFDDYVSAPSTPDYINVKFDIYQSNFDNPVCANDIPLMRIEEMYLILAEAQAMGGNPALGAQTLTGLISTYRDPAYSCTAGTAEAVREEVWNQRRVELWGEGIAYLDIMRLKKNIDRRGAGFEPAYCFNIQPDDPILLFQIPQTEVQGNRQLGANNPEASDVPTPVSDN